MYHEINSEVCLIMTHLAVLLIDIANILRCAKLCIRGFTERKRDRLMMR